MLKKFGTRILPFLAATAFAAEPHPIVEIDTGFLVGGSGRGKWISAEAAKRAIKGGEQYQIYSLTERLGTVTGGKPESAGEPCVEVQVIPFKTKPVKGVLAIAGQWNALSRIPKAESTTQPAYLKAVREFLVAKGIRNPKVKITQILRIDLEGDGEDEVLLSGTNYFNKEDDGVPSSAPQGSYSFVILRRVVEGKVRTQLVAGDFYPKAKVFNAPATYKVAAVLDVDGDGPMEVVVDGGYYEDGWTTIFRCTSKKIEQVLEVGCDA